MFPDDAPKPHYKPAPKFEIPRGLDREEECFGCGGSGNAHHHRVSGLSVRVPTAATARERLPSW